eukprot:TRINITY_DN20263_c0_g4_i3.p1 TRINITY_DN20263_c0_g4~~TRINITY_DN20263_c0_g4_i3.p1  ORF type:complete len:233 (-),score=38.93 TRINITY_DN20263_c0_g4_i3:499-1197(-)
MVVNVEHHDDNGTETSPKNVVTTMALKQRTSRRKQLLHWSLLPSLCLGGVRLSGLWGYALAAFGRLPSSPAACRRLQLGTRDLESSDDAASIHWPSQNFQNFEAACKAAVDLAVPLHLQPGTRVQMGDDVFQIRGNRDVLRIMCSGEGFIEGSGHSIFSVYGRHSSLELHGINLRHIARSKSGDGTDVGAAIFAMGRSATKLFNSSVTSVSGLGIWLVQEASLNAQDVKLLG